MEAEARQSAAEGPRCALDQEAWPQLLRLQEPCERGRQAQADPALTDAAVHDSQVLDGLLDKGNTCNDVFADSAYRSAKIESKLRASGYNSRIHRQHCRACHYPRSSVASARFSGHGYGSSSPSTGTLATRAVASAGPTP